MTILITPRSRSIFKALKAATDNDIFWRLQGDLHQELKLPPWQWPAVVDPTDKSDKDADAKALWTTLDEKKKK